jgi:hypothetical protein
MAGVPGSSLHTALGCADPSPCSNTASLTPAKNMQMCMSCTHVCTTCECRENNTKAVACSTIRCNARPNSSQKAKPHLSGNRRHAHATIVHVVKRFSDRPTGSCPVVCNRQRRKLPSGRRLHCSVADVTVISAHANGSQLLRKLVKQLSCVHLRMCCTLAYWQSLQSPCTSHAVAKTIGLQVVAA